jgi:predicted phosphodiesterase
MKTLTFISDTHCLHNLIPADQLPGGDFLIHTGDWTNSGTFPQIEDFLSWFSNQTQYTHRIFIAGNHELKVESWPSVFRDMVPNNCIYLEDSGITIEGINFYGTPVTPVFCNWAFNKTFEQLKRHFDNIPYTTDVLLTHGGAHLQTLESGQDVHIPELRNKIKELTQLKISAFGHIHHSYSQQTIDGITYVNSAIVGEDYRRANKPITIIL